MKFTFRTLLILSLFLSGVSALAGTQDKCGSIFTEQVIWKNNDFVNLEILKKGNLGIRAQALIDLYPQNITLVKDVRLSMKDWNGTRDLLVISTKGLSAEQIVKMEQDYVSHLAFGTLSFPLGQNAGHLYTRFGQKTFDLIHSLNVRDYRFGNERLEPFIQLTPAEQFNLVTYLKNAVKSKNKVIGPFKYDGVKKSNQKLNDNKPCTGGHNCTSWITTSGIGVDGINLMNMVGAIPSRGYGTNPGWWSGFLNVKGNSDRVPFSVYMNPRLSIKEIQNELQRNGHQLRWEFNPQ